MSDTHVHVLGATRARSGEDPLIPFLLTARGSPARISARDVKRLDSHRLQALLVAKNQWKKDGLAFEVTDVTETFALSLERLGLSKVTFGLERGN